jgi:hypothetical protein
MSTISSSYINMRRQNLYAASQYRETVGPLID